LASKWVAAPLVEVADAVEVWLAVEALETALVVLALEVAEAVEEVETAAEEVDRDTEEDTDEATLPVEDVVGAPELLGEELLLGVVPTQLVLVPAMTVMGEEY